MNNAKLYLCLVLVVLTVNLIECRGGHGGGHGGSHGHSGHSSHSGGSHGSHGSHGGGGGWFSGWFSGGSRNTGSSGHSYPPSSGYSGHGTGGSHSYPKSPGLSGSGSAGSYWGSPHYVQSRPTYYTAPQHVYVTQYRQAQSPYSDILTGLTMYNLGRSHSYHHHYYHDDYYRSSSSGSYYNHHTNTRSDSNNNNVGETNDEAKCALKIKKNGKLEVISIPCAIVSTFDNGNRTLNGAVRDETVNNCTNAVNMNMTLDVNSTLVNNVNSKNSSLDNNISANNSFINPCVNQIVDIKDPMSVTGAPIASVEATNMECSVEIRTNQEMIQNSVDCDTLLKYAKMPVPEDKITHILPSRGKLKAMLNKPPWWMSLFVAV